MDNVEFWYWWVLGLVLLVLELFAPGAFFLWIGIAAGVVGVLLWMLPDLGWQFQLMWFALFSVVSIVAWHSFAKQRPSPSDHPTLNRRGEQYIGRVFTLNEPIINGDGKITVDDSTWKVEGSDCPSGTRVKVVGVDGVILKVDIVSA
jgi:hypothetical protein